MNTPQEDTTCRQCLAKIPSANTLIHFADHIKLKTHCNFIKCSHCNFRTNNIKQALQHQTHCPYEVIRAVNARDQIIMTRRCIKCRKIINGDITKKPKHECTMQRKNVDENYRITYRDIQIPPLLLYDAVNHLGLYEKLSQFYHQRNKNQKEKD